MNQCVFGMVGCRDQLSGGETRGAAINVAEGGMSLDILMDTSVTRQKLFIVDASLKSAALLTHLLSQSDSRTFTLL